MTRLVAMIVLCLSFASQADERILSFHSDVRVYDDGMIEVTETIKVRAEGTQILRGIYRDFPVEYQDRLGNTYNITLEPQAVRRDGKPESFHSVRSGRDVRTYFGRSDYFIEHGEHTYEFRYRANRMLGYFEQHDELYWNVTGNNWTFPIDKATATIRLMFDAPRDSILVEGYTGRPGSTAQDYGRFMDDAGNVHFQANNLLPAAHGLTIVVGWPKGFVEEPTALDRTGWLLNDNRNLLAALAGYLLLLLYYVPVWNRHGKDPAEGILVTRYEPPKGFSPASLRYIRQMYYDDKVMTAAIVNLAVKGYLVIKKKGKTHSLHKVDNGTSRPAMAPGEEELYTAIFKEDDVVTLKDFNHKLLGKARADHSESLLADYDQHYFKRNSLLNLPAFVIVIGSTVLAVNIGNGPTPMVIATIVLSFLTTAFFAIIMKRPTIRGRKLLDEMLGFKDFLEIAEKDEHIRRNPLAKTPELFEAFLPYALALGVDQQWSEQFAKVLGAIRNRDGSSYSPSWYDGKWSSSNLSRATQGLSSGLSSAVGSSISPPGSSSGGGGGGSSGGGGGGGGGGGW